MSVKEKNDICARCQKPQQLCVCSLIVPLERRTKVLILQHPQEPDKILGSALLAHLMLPNSTLRIGLSWPNLKRAAGIADIPPAQWLVLYLGSKQLLQKKTSFTPALEGKLGGLLLIDRKDRPRPDSAQVLKTIQGIIVLDGNWSQAKSLWWRNPWLLKCQRALLMPNRPSLYAELRREPRRESLSTIEAIALTLSALEQDFQLPEKLLKPFGEMLVRYSSSNATEPTATLPET